MPLKLILWDVQHGSAAYIHTPNGKHLAIDLGAGDAEHGGFSPLQYLNGKGIVFDHLTITHPHLDHIDDILNLRSPRILSTPRQLTDAEVWNGHDSSSQETQRKVVKYLDLRRIYCNAVSAQTDPLTAQNNGGVSITQFHPRKSSHSNPNNHSIVKYSNCYGVPRGEIPDSRRQ